MDTITENTQGYTQPDYNQFLNMDSHQQPNYATLTSQSHKQPISGKFKNIFFSKKYFFTIILVRNGILSNYFLLNMEIFAKLDFRQTKKSNFQNIHI